MKLVFVTSGWARLHSERGTVEVEAGSIIAMPAGIWCVVEPAGGVETVIVYTQSDYAKTQLRWMPPAHPLTNQLRAASLDQGHLSVLSINKPLMRMIAPKLLSVASLGQRVGQEFVTLTLLSSVLDDLGRLGRTRVAGADPQTVRRSLLPRREVAEAVRSMRSDLRHGWTLSELSAQVALSESQLTRAFRHELGISPGALLWQMRTDRAAELLTTARLTAAQAFQQAGWTSMSAASRAFKRRYGVGPSEFKTRLGGFGGLPYAADSPLDSAAALSVLLRNS